MKKLLIAFLLLCSIASQAQFNTTDSLRRYNTRFISNSPINAFSSLRMNTLLNGIINWLDTARLGTGGSVGMDTLYHVNDSVYQYKKNGSFYYVQMPGVYDSRRKVDTMYTTNDSTLIYKVNGQSRTLSIRGVGGSGGI